MGKNSCIRLAVFLLLALFLSAACAREEQKAPPVTAPAKVVPAETKLKGGWEAQWEQTLALAKKEGNLIIFSFYGAELSRPVSQAMKEKFGINVEWMTLRGGEMAEKVLRERKAGLFLADITLHGTGTGLNIIKPAGITESLETQLLIPEVTDPKVWLNEKLPFIDKDLHFIFFRANVDPNLFINTDQAKKEDFPSYKDLLNPRWKGKIIWDDPTVGGPGSMAFRVIGLQIMNLDYIKELVKQNPVLMRDRRLAADWIARGRYPIGIGLDPSLINQFRKTGAPIAMFNPGEGGHITSGGGNIYMFKDAPHPYARKIFINWFLSREGQTIFSQATGEQSAREDIAVSHLDQDSVRQKGMRYFNAITEEWQSLQDQHLKLAKEIFAPVLK